MAESDETYKLIQGYSLIIILFLTSDPFTVQGLEHKVAIQYSLIEGIFWLGLRINKPME